ncbi:Protein RcsF [Rhodovulum sp. P5]|nr:Protein RcsF [Rhodovulum sp. P5]
MDRPMEGYKRYAIYYAPEAGPLADFGAAWLGWDPKAGSPRAHLRLENLPRPIGELTEKPRKYGFHGTVKPPFRLIEGSDIGLLHRSAAALCAQLKPVLLDGLQLSRIGGFLALTPRGDTGALGALAGSVVEALDGFRAAPTDEEIARRNPDRLSARQRQLLQKWGYPYVMEEFRFHLTLTGPLKDEEAEATRDVLEPLLASQLNRPFRIASLCLFGEADDGRFHNLHRYSLSG